MQLVVTALRCLQMFTNLQILGHANFKLQKSFLVCDCVAGQSEFESKDYHLQRKGDIIFI
jgi:hypothetical protein